MQTCIAFNYISYVMNHYIYIRVGHTIFFASWACETCLESCIVPFQWLEAHLMQKRSMSCTCNFSRNKYYIVPLCKYIEISQQFQCLSKDISLTLKSKQLHKNTHEKYIIRLFNLLQSLRKSYLESTLGTSALDSSISSLITYEDTVITVT